MVGLVSDIIIERNITYLLYLWSGSCLILFMIILWRMGLFKRALLALGVSFVVNIGWEISLWINDTRAYDSGLPMWFEFIYHGLTELAPFVLFLMICLKLFGFIKADKNGTVNDSGLSKGEGERIMGGSDMEAGAGGLDQGNGDGGDQ